MSRAPSLDSGRESIKVLHRQFAKPTDTVFVSIESLAWSKITSHMCDMRIILKLTTRIRCSVVKRRTESGFVLMRMRLLRELRVPLVRHFLVVAQLNSYKRGMNFLTRRRSTVWRRRAETLSGRKSIAGCGRRWLRKGMTGEGLMRECMIGGVVLPWRLQPWIISRRSRRSWTRIMIQNRFHSSSRHNTRISVGTVDLVGAVTFISLISFFIRLMIHIASFRLFFFIKTVSSLFSWNFRVAEYFHF